MKQFVECTHSETILNEAQQTTHILLIGFDVRYRKTIKKYVVIPYTMKTYICGI